MLTKQFCAVEVIKANRTLQFQWVLMDVMMVIVQSLLSQETLPTQLALTLLNLYCVDNEVSLEFFGGWKFFLAL